MPFDKAGDKRMDEKRIKDFYRIVPNTDCQKELLEEMKWICDRRAGYGAVCMVSV